MQAFPSRSNIHDYMGWQNVTSWPHICIYSFGSHEKWMLTLELLPWFISLGAVMLIDAKPRTSNQQETRFDSDGLTCGWRALRVGSFRRRRVYLSGVSGYASSTWSRNSWAALSCSLSIWLRFPLRTFSVWYDTGNFFSFYVTKACILAYIVLTSIPSKMGAYLPVIFLFLGK